MRNKTRMPRREFDIHQPRDENGKWTSEYVHEAAADLASIGGSLHFGLDKAGDVESTLSFDDGEEHEFMLTAAGSAHFLDIMNRAIDVHDESDFPLDDSKDRIAFSEEVDNDEVSGIDYLSLTVDDAGDVLLYFEELKETSSGRGHNEPFEFNPSIDELREMRDALDEIETQAGENDLRAQKPGKVRAMRTKVREPERFDVVRDVYRTAELRAAEDLPDDVLGVVSGHFSVFDTWYRIASWWEGDFVERVAPGAFRKTIAERGQSVVSAFDHGMDPTIGDKVLGPFRSLKEDRTGGYYEIDLLDTSYNRDLMPGLKRGLYSASFRFQVLKDEWNNEAEHSDHNPDGLPERTIKEVRLYELGPVTYPANPAATAAMRSGTDAFYERLARREPARVDALRSRISSLRTVPARTADAAARKTHTEPRKHSGLSARDRRERLYPTLKGVTA